MYQITKRALDALLAGLGLLALSPAFVVISLAIKRDSEGPIFYRAPRAGRYGKPFYMLKFRSMVVNADRIGGPSTSGNDPRLTIVGKWLRNYKLDELPQLINVVMGEMSLVGPRPEVLSEVEKYTAEERRLLSVRPGMTDWASIKFNDEGEILNGAADPHQAYLEKIRPEKVRLGLEYVRTHSMLVDLNILFRTVTTVLETRAG